MRQASLRRAGPRWRGAAPRAAVVLAVVLAAGLGVVGGPTACGEDEPPPVTAARAFARAIRMGDVKTMLTLVDTQTVTRVSQAAERASDQVGGRRSVEPMEMLQVVDVDPRFQIASAELREGDDQRAVVQLTGADGTVHSLELINEDGAWRVLLPRPPGPIGES